MAKSAFDELTQPRAADVVSMGGPYESLASDLLSMNFPMVNPSVAGPANQPVEMAPMAMASPYELGNLSPVPQIDITDELLKQKFIEEKIAPAQPATKARPSVQQVAAQRAGVTQPQADPEMLRLMAQAFNDGGASTSILNAALPVEVQQRNQLLTDRRDNASFEQLYAIKSLQDRLSMERAQREIEEDKINYQRQQDALALQQKQIEMQQAKEIHEAKMQEYRDKAAASKREQSPESQAREKQTDIARILQMTGGYMPIVDEGGEVSLKPFAEMTDDDIDKSLRSYDVAGVGRIPLWVHKNGVVTDLAGNIVAGDKISDQRPMSAQEMMLYMMGGGTPGGPAQSTEPSGEFDKYYEGI